MWATLPNDICGVAGGDGTTCDDGCGVPNGDNSTCADVCGIPYGNGTACLSSTDSSNLNCTVSSDGVVNEKQVVRWLNAN